MPNTVPSGRQTVTMTASAVTSPVAELHRDCHFALFHVQPLRRTSATPTAPLPAAAAIAPRSATAENPSASTPCRSCCAPHRSGSAAAARASPRRERPRPSPAPSRRRRQIVIVVVPNHHRRLMLSCSRQPIHIRRFLTPLLQDLFRAPRAPHCSPPPDRRPSAPPSGTHSTSGLSMPLVASVRNPSKYSFPSNSNDHDSIPARFTRVSSCRSNSPFIAAAV